jgi:hypothetical protein
MLAYIKNVLTWLGIGLLATAGFLLGVAVWSLMFGAVLLALLSAVYLALRAFSYLFELLA